MRGNHTVHLCWKAHQPVDVLCELPPGKAVIWKLEKQRLAT